jgi:hypothetical protein
MMIRKVTLTFVLICVTGCDARSRHEPPTPARVGELLYGQNLIADGEVSAKVAEFVVRVDSAGALPDAVLPELHAWLETWIAAHPDRAARARMIPRPSIR